MIDRRANPFTERGGIIVRDYTQGGMTKGDTRPGLLKKINFDRVARSLVWFSLGLGLAEVLMPRRIQKLVGVRRGQHSGLIRFAGFREIGHAILLLMQPRPQQALMTRVAGDVMDLGLLAAAFNTPRVKKERLAAATVTIAAITALDALTAVQVRRTRADEKRYSMLTQADLEGRSPGGGFHVVKSITINRSPEELYRFWRNFENLPQFMYHLQEVRVIDDRRSHWRTSAPAGMQVEWDAEITDDRPNELIAWRSINNADVPNSGIVRFEPQPHGRGTVVHVEIDYDPPAGALGKAVAKLFGEEPRQQVKGDLNRFKQVIETGEVVLSEGSPRGLGQKMQHPARPAQPAQETLRDNKNSAKFVERETPPKRTRAAQRVSNR